MIGGIQVCNLNVNANQKSVQRVDIVNPGAGYTVAPGIAITSTSGTGAAGTAYIGDGTVGVVTLTANGSGFTTAPTITFDAPVGVGTTATGVGVLNAAGSLIAINITNAGAGYTLAPNITIGDPSLDSTGDYNFNEMVTGAVSGATGRVRSWNTVKNELEVASVSGTFSIGEKIVGAISGASHALRRADDMPDSDEFADNFDIETEADKILDFSETNPFGIP